MYFIAALLLLFIFALPSKAAAFCGEYNRHMPHCAGPATVKHKIAAKHAKRSTAYSPYSGRPVYKRKGAAVRVQTPGRRSAVTLAGVVAPLAAKVNEIIVACGSRVVSGVRHTNVAGTGIRSLHSSGRAVDVAGNPICIYALLRGWDRAGGGYTTDYGSAPNGRHVHISYGGREAGRVFAHRKPRYRRVAQGD